jgi:hypothetical protein
MLTNQVKHLVWSSSGTSCVLNTPQKMVEIVRLQFWNTSDSTTCHFITPMRDLRFIWSFWPFRMKAIHPFETSVCTHPATQCHIPEALNHLDPCFTCLLYPLWHFMYDISSKIYFLSTLNSIPRRFLTSELLEDSESALRQIGSSKLQILELGPGVGRGLLKYFISWHLFDMDVLQGSLK